MKRHEVLVSHYKKVEEETGEDFDTLISLTEKHFNRGMLSREEFAELVEFRDAAEEKYLEAMTRRFRATCNARRSHIAYCRARVLASQVQLLTHREALALASKSPQVVSEIHSPELELIENSLPSHAPPLEPRFQNGTGSS